MMPKVVSHFECVGEDEAKHVDKGPSRLGGSSSQKGQGHAPFSARANQELRLGAPIPSTCSEVIFGLSSENLSIVCSIVNPPYYMLARHPLQLMSSSEAVREDHTRCGVL